MDLDIEWFRAEPSSHVERKRAIRVRKARDWFLKGPIPGKWLSCACRLSPGALRVSLAVWYLVGVKRSRTVKLTWRVLELFAIHRQTAYRALVALEKAGLVTVVRAKGSCPVVTIIERGVA